MGQVQPGLGSSFPGSAQGKLKFKGSSGPKVLLSYYHPHRDTGTVLFVF